MQASPLETKAAVPSLLVAHNRLSSVDMVALSIAICGRQYEQCRIQPPVIQHCGYCVVASRNQDFVQINNVNNVGNTVPLKF